MTTHSPSSTAPGAGAPDDLTAALRPLVSGAVTGPPDPGYDAARVAWNLAIDQRPLAVVEAADAADVAAVLAFARQHGHRVAPQLTGHAAGALGDLADTILLRTGALRGVEVDAAARTVRVAAGTQWAEVLAASAPHGLAPLAGSAGDVGVVGYTLGGGVSFLGRRHGLASNHVLSADIVLLDGTTVRADKDNQADLFWAVRGGGVPVGVVVGLELALHPVPELTVGQLFWPIERAPEVLRAWRDWTATAPEGATTTARLMRFPPDPAVPEPLRGGAFAVVDGAWLGTPETAAELLRPLTDLEPLMDTWAAAGIPALTELHLDPPAPVPAMADHTLLADLDDATLDALVTVAGADSGTPLIVVELRHLGGALARAVDGGGAVSSVAAGFVLLAIGIPFGPGGPEGALARLDAVRKAAAGQAAGVLTSWVDAPGVPRGHAPEVAERLAGLRATHDPRGVLRFAGDTPG